MKPIKQGDEILGYYTLEKPPKVNYSVNVTDAIVSYGIITLLVVCVILTIK